MLKLILAVFVAVLMLTTRVFAQDHADKKDHVRLMNEISNDVSLVMPEDAPANDLFDGVECEGAFIPDNGQDTASSTAYSTAKLLYRDSCSLVRNDTLYTRMRFIDARVGMPRRVLFVGYGRAWYRASETVSECVVWFNTAFRYGGAPGRSFTRIEENGCGAKLPELFELLKRFKS